MSFHGLIAYQTLPLDPTQRKIRTLHLLPGTNENICGKLEILDLDQRVEPYVCVSYVWGDASITRSIWVEGEELQVTTNLFDLLQNIRHPHHTVVIWVDAICINQTDLIERSHQVALMDDVYSLCSSVYIWLGALPRGPKWANKDPFYLLKHFAAEKHYHDLPGYTKDGNEVWMFEEAHAEFQEMWSAFLLVADNSWWTRACK